jgi:segregation and condensation protein A
MQRRLQLLMPLEAEPTAMPAPKIITIADVRERVRTVLHQRPWTTFDDLLSLALTRNEVIVTLWTVLELFKRQYITIEQQEMFGAIAIGRGGTFTDDPERNLLIDEQIKDAEVEHSTPASFGHDELQD